VGWSDGEFFFFFFLGLGFFHGGDLVVGGSFAWLGGSVLAVLGGGFGRGFLGGGWGSLFFFSFSLLCLVLFVFLVFVWVSGFLGLFWFGWFGLGVCFFVFFGVGGGVFFCFLGVVLFCGFFPFLLGVSGCLGLVGGLFGWFVVPLWGVFFSFFFFFCVGGSVGVGVLCCSGGGGGFFSLFGVWFWPCCFFFVCVGGVWLFCFFLLVFWGGLGVVCLWGFGCVCGWGVFFFFFCLVFPLFREMSFYPEGHALDSLVPIVVSLPCPRS